jgi:glycosyltransferase involved in cell wall biosynthesis
VENEYDEDAEEDNVCGQQRFGRQSFGRLFAAGAGKIEWCSVLDWAAVRRRRACEAIRTVYWEIGEYIAQKHKFLERERGRMKVYMLYHGVLDAQGKQPLVGGIETYLIALANLVRELGMEPIMLQRGDRPFQAEHDGIPVVGVSANRSETKQVLYREALARMDTTADILVFGADHVSVPCDYPRAIAIQHGVSWDLPYSMLSGGRIDRIPFLPDILKKWRVAYQAVQSFNNCPNRVCVDYNFVNWYRTMIPGKVKGRMWVIPNFAPAPPPDTAPRDLRGDGQSVRIIFARRFTDYRGTGLMVETARRLLPRYANLHFTFAGEGPEESAIRRAFAGESRVSVGRYDSGDSVRIHQEHDIAVVPSIASEGTSLSVAEAMMAGCAVIAANVGGITNMIVNGYNGLLVMPDADDLTAALETLIQNPDEARLLGERGRCTAETAFSKNVWKHSWTKVLKTVCETRPTAQGARQ